jgi:hypothetical protein
MALQSTRRCGHAHCARVAFALPYRLDLRNLQSRLNEAANLAIETRNYHLTFILTFWKLYHGVGKE